MLQIITELAGSRSSSRQTWRRRVVSCHFLSSFFVFSHAYWNNSLHRPHTINLSP